MLGRGSTGFCVALGPARGSNHAPSDVAIDGISYHNYLMGNGELGELAPRWFAEMDAFLDESRRIEQMKQQLLPGTRTFINEIGCGSHGATYLAADFYVLCAATYAYAFAKGSLAQVEHFGMSQVIGFTAGRVCDGCADEWPSTSMVNWYDGSGNVEQWTKGFVHFADITTPLSVPKAHWVVTTEAGEHIPNGFEGTFIRNLHAHNCKGILLSWAAPRKTGVGHVNTHTDVYLQGIFAQLGYRLNEPLTRSLRANRTRAAFAASFRGRPFIGAKNETSAMQNRWTNKALRWRNVSQAWWWIRAMVLERVEPLIGPGCTVG